MRSLTGKGWVANWKPEGVVAHNAKALARGLGKAAAHLSGELKQDLSKPGPLGKLRTGMYVKQGLEVDPGTSGSTDIRPSKPGEPPRKRTGALRAAVRSEKVTDDGLLWRVGTPASVPYGYYLEFGTKLGLAPRPWLRPGLARESPRMRQIVIEELKA